MKIVTAGPPMKVSDLKSLIYIGEEKRSWVLGASMLCRVDSSGRLQALSITDREPTPFRARGVDLLCDRSSIHVIEEAVRCVPPPSTHITHIYDRYATNRASSSPPLCQLFIERSTKAFHWEMPDGSSTSQVRQEMGAFLDAIEIGPWQ